MALAAAASRMRAQRSALAPELPLATAFSATWEGDAALPTLAFGSYVDPASGDQTPYRCADNELFRPDTSGTAVRRADAADAELLRAVDAVQRLGRLRPARPARDATTASTTTTRSAASSCGASTPGQAPRLYTEADGWAFLQLWGMGIASYDVTGDGQPEVYLTSQGANRLQSLVDGPAQPAYHDIALERTMSMPRGRPSAATRCRRRPGTRSSRTSTTTGSWTCSCPRATSTRSPTTRSGTRATCSSGSRTARLPSVPRQAGIGHVRQGSWRRARGLQPGRPAGPDPGQPRHAGARVAQRRRRNG